MTLQRHKDFGRLQRDFGIVLPEAVTFTDAEWRRDFNLAMDAQPALVSVSNNGIPAFLTTLVDPDVIRVLTTPNRAAEIYGEAQKGSWITKTAMFIMVESTGEVSSYGDWNANGSNGVNINFPQRQSYHYQTISQYGDMQLELAGEAKINFVSELDVSAATVLSKFQNDTYFFGVAGLQNYGALNDPSLPSPIAPNTKAAGGVTWAAGTAEEIYADLLKLFKQLQLQSNQLITMDDELVIALAADKETNFAKTNSFGINVTDLIKKNFKNLTVQTAVQYNTVGGAIVQMFAKKIDGKDTAYTAFTEKMRAHGVVRELSAWAQKKSQGTWGTVIRYPFAFASMIGI